MKEAIFEPILRKLRIQRVKNIIVNFTPPPHEL